VRGFLSRKQLKKVTITTLADYKETRDGNKLRIIVEEKFKFLNNSTNYKIVVKANKDKEKMKVKEADLPCEKEFFSMYVRQCLVVVWKKGKSDKIDKIYLDGSKFKLQKQIREEVETVITTEKKVYRKTVEESKEVESSVTEIHKQGEIRMQGKVEVKKK